MATSSKTITKRRFDTADEHRPFPLGGNDVVTIGGVTLGLSRYEPGWKWSEAIRPTAGTESCEVEHLGYMLSGRICAKMNDGSEMEFVAGDLVFIPAGHDGWTVGDEAAVLFQIMVAATHSETT